MVLTKMKETAEAYLGGEQCRKHKVMDKEQLPDSFHNHSIFISYSFHIHSETNQGLENCYSPDTGNTIILKPIYRYSIIT